MSLKQTMKSNKVGHRLSKMMPALLAWCIILSVTGAFYFFVIPKFIAYYCTWGVVVSILELIVTLFVLSNFFMATVMDPGVILINNEAAEQMEDFRTPLYKNVEIKGINVRLKWCISCHIYRPPRSSHCSTCNQCIEMFDHHCPWVNNCIGRRNYKQFVLFLISLVLHMILVTGICMAFVSRSSEILVSEENVAAIISIVMCVVMFLPILGLTGYHFVLMMKARTTNEHVTGKFSGSNNPFTRGFFGNCFNVMCAPQYPAQLKAASIYGGRRSKCKKRHRKQKSTSLSMLTNGNNIQNGKINGISAGSGDQNQNQKLQPVAAAKKRVQLAASLSGNVYHLNEQGCAELIEAPPCESLLANDHHQRQAFFDNAENDDPDQQIMMEGAAVELFDTTVHHSKERVVTSLSRASSRVTIDTNNSHHNAGLGGGGSSSSTFNLNESCRASKAIIAPGGGGLKLTLRDADASLLLLGSHCNLLDDTDTAHLNDLAATASMDGESDSERFHSAATSAATARVVERV